MSLSLPFISKPPQFHQPPPAPLDWPGLAENYVSLLPEKGRERDFAVPDIEVV